MVETAICPRVRGGRSSFRVGTKSNEMGSEAMGDLDPVPATCLNSRIQNALGGRLPGKVQLGPDHIGPSKCVELLNYLHSRSLSLTVFGSTYFLGRNSRYFD